jgi:hypothetical protein
MLKHTGIIIFGLAGVGTILLAGVVNAQQVTRTTVKTTTTVTTTPRKKVAPQRKEGDACLRRSSEQNPPSNDGMWILRDGRWVCTWNGAG